MDMVYSYLSTQVCINVFDGLWENTFYGHTTDGKTDAHSTVKALLTQSSRAKNLVYLSSIWLGGESGL